MYKHYVRQKTLWIDTSYDKIGQYLDISPSMCVFSISASLWLPTCLSISAYLFRGGGGACLPTYTFDIASKALDTQYKITVTHPPHTHTHTNIRVPHNLLWNPHMHHNGQIPGQQSCLMGNFLGDQGWRSGHVIHVSNTWALPLSRVGWGTWHDHRHPLINSPSIGIRCPHRPITPWWWWSVH